MGNLDGYNVFELWSCGPGGIDSDLLSEMQETLDPTAPSCAARKAVQGDLPVTREMRRCAVLKALEVTQCSPDSDGSLAVHHKAGLSGLEQSSWKWTAACASSQVALQLDFLPRSDLQSKAVCASVNCQLCLAHASY